MLLGLGLSFRVSVTWKSKFDVLQIGILWNKASAAFWHPAFWLPSGLQWEDLVDREDLHYPKIHDVCVYPLFLGVLLLLAKNFIIVPFLLEPLAQLAGISNKRPRPPVPCHVMEEVFRRHGHNPPKKQLMEASDASGMSTRNAERWLRRRRIVSQTTTYEKFIDCGFNLVCHTTLTVLGMVVMFSKPWTWDISVTWADYPHHHVDDDMWWYYMCALSYFWASTFLQVHSSGRSTFDKVQMMLHHLFTVLLMVFSWACNFIRSGSLVLLVHEVSDVPLLSAKMLTYAGIKGPTDAIFVVFILSWAVTRCYLYPFWIMKEVLIQTGEGFQTPAFRLQYGLVCGLLAIDLVWTFLIGRVVVRKVTAGSLQDVRSEAEDMTTDMTDSEAKGKKKAE
ncbi:Ceramide synthase 2 [Portunus trituberculatus]|uniref:Ceramide synthase 2 n=1 Tax=Portunus trituberculatus TaxID=210409 RepID=A0A5B7JDP0_PORTR|nr:Ceramide synthase 2 [Portunus trituberculatus]